MKTEQASREFVLACVQEDPRLIAAAMQDVTLIAKTGNTFMVAARTTADRVVQARAVSVRGLDDEALRVLATELVQMLLNGERQSFDRDLTGYAEE